MKVLEFEAEVPGDGTLKIPNEIAVQIPDHEQVRVLLLVGDSSEDEDWERLGAEEFLSGYSESDAIYDQLSRG